MNETANNTDILAPLSKILTHADDKIVELAIAIEHIKSLMYFLGDFFSFETIDPDRINDSDTRDRAVLYLSKYQHYRSLYETVSALLMDNENEAVQIGECIDNAMVYIRSAHRNAVEA